MHNNFLYKSICNLIKDKIYNLIDFKDKKIQRKKIKYIYTHNKKIII